MNKRESEDVGHRGQYNKFRPRLVKQALSDPTPRKDFSVPAAGSATYSLQSSTLPGISLQKAVLP